MVRTGSILAAAIILLACWYPSIKGDDTLFAKQAIAFTIIVLAIILQAFVLYRLTELKLREEVEKKIYKELHDNYFPNHKLRPVPAGIVNSMNIYNAMATRNYWMYRALGIISLASSLFLAVAIGQTEYVPVYATKILAFISSLSTGIIFSFNLVEKSNRARRAFRHLLNAIMLFQHNQMTMLNLLKNYSEAESYLGDDEFKQPAGSSASLK